jgi:hypothetical protein
LIVPLGRVFKCGERMQSQENEKWESIVKLQKRLNRKKERIADKSHVENG